MDTHKDHNLTYRYQGTYILEAHADNGRLIGGNGEDIIRTGDPYLFCETCGAKISPELAGIKGPLVLNYY